MRLQMSRPAADERIVQALSRGHTLLASIRADCTAKRQNGTFNATTDNASYKQAVRDWVTVVVSELEAIFPTKLESQQFVAAPATNITYQSGENAAFGSIRNRLLDLLDALRRIREVSLDQYSDLPIGTRLYVEDIESFHKVRDVNPAMVAAKARQGYLSETENHVQACLEQILGVTFHQGDWGGELNDLYTANIRVAGRPVSAAFLLKGRGLNRRDMRIADCGKNGDQLVRLFDSPAELFVVQFVGRVDEMVVKDVEGKTEHRRQAGKSAWFMIIDGQDTARLLLAYGMFRDAVDR